MEKWEYNGPHGKEVVHFRNAFRCRSANSLRPPTQTSCGDDLRSRGNATRSRLVSSSTNADEPMIPPDVKSASSTSSCPDWSLSMRCCICSLWMDSIVDQSSALPYMNLYPLLANSLPPTAAPKEHHLYSAGWAHIPARQGFRSM